MAGSPWLDGLGLPQPYAGKVTSLRQLPGELTTEITMLGDVIADLLRGDRGYQVIQQLPGIGPVLPPVIIAEVGDVIRFKNAGQLCSQSGLTPRHRESDTKVTCGHATKQGSRLLRWALIEAIQRVPADCRSARPRRPSSPAAGSQPRTLPRSPPPAGFSPWSSTACATGRSAAWSRPPKTHRRQPRHSGRHEQLPLAGGQARGRRSVCPAAFPPRCGRRLIDPPDRFP